MPCHSTDLQKTLRCVRQAFMVEPWNGCCVSEALKLNEGEAVAIS
jgi:hypothetical protein